jgi:hypothetical protein
VARVEAEAVHLLAKDAALAAVVLQAEPPQQIGPPEGLGDRLRQELARIPAGRHVPTPYPGTRSVPRTE